MLLFIKTGGVLEIVPHGGLPQGALPVRGLNRSLRDNLPDNPRLHQEDETAGEQQNKNPGHQDLQHLHRGQGAVLAGEGEQEQGPLIINYFLYSLSLFY